MNYVYVYLLVAVTLVGMTTAGFTGNDGEDRSLFVDSNFRIDYS